MTVSTPRVSRGASVRAHAAAPMVIALSLVLLAIYGIRVVGAGPAQGARADFASSYTGATIVRDGDAHRLYDLTLQSTVGDRVVAPARLTLPYDAMPLGAVALVPLTLLPLETAFVVWTTAQFLLVVVAVAIAVRAAPSPRPRSRTAAFAIVGIAVTQVGLENLVGVGQSTGISAFGVAMAYRCLRRGSFTAAGVWIVATAALMKPDLAIGLAAFLIGCGNRRALVGALGAGIAYLGASLAIVGIGGLGALVSNDVRLAGVLNQAGGASFIALPSVWFGNTTLSYVGGAVGAVVCVGICGVLGQRFHRNPALLGPALAAATALSLLASPHAYLYDEVMLAPAVAWSLAELGLFTVPQRRGLDNAWTIVVIWGVLPWGQTLFVTVLLPLVTRIGILFPWLTVALTAALWSIPAQARTVARHPLPESKYDRSLAEQTAEQ